MKETMDAYTTTLKRAAEIKAETQQLKVRLAMLKQEQAGFVRPPPCFVAGCDTKVCGAGFMCHNHHLRSVKARKKNVRLEGYTWVAPDKSVYGKCAKCTKELVRVHYDRCIGEVDICPCCGYICNGVSGRFSPYQRDAYNVLHDHFDAGMDTEAYGVLPTGNEKWFKRMVAALRIYITVINYANTKAGRK